MNPINLITHVFFDAGNTLVYVNMEEVSRALARRGVHLSAGELWRAEHAIRPLIDDPDLIRRSDDDSRWRLYFEAFLGRAGAPLDGSLDPVLADLNAYHEAHNLWELVPPEVPFLLDRLRGRYRLGVISNSNGTVREKLRRVGLLPYFDLVIDSKEEGIEKPDPRIFRAALERLGARPGRSVHVGDFYHIDVVGARAAGLRAVLLDPAGVHGDKFVPRLASLLEFPELLRRL